MSMAISGADLYSSQSYSYRVNTSSESTQQTGKPEGPPPPPRGGRGQQGPQVDTDSDGYWSSDELEDLVSDLNEENGTSLDSDAIMSEYDTDGDGYISEAESEAVKENNAFELKRPNLENVQGMMKGGGMPPVQMSESTSSESSSISIDASDELVDTMVEILEELQAEQEAEQEEDTEVAQKNTNLVSKALQAYGVQADYSNYSIAATYDAEAV